MDFTGMDLESLAYLSSMYGADMMRQSAREANIKNVMLAREATRFQGQQAQKQMDFQREMSNTAHQREMADLMAAGLNPILTATGGAGAPAMSGAMAHAAVPEVQSELKDNPLKDLAQSVTAARKFKDLELEMMRSNVALNETMAGKNREDVETQRTQQELNKSLMLRSIEEIATQQSQQRLNGAATAREFANANLATANAGVAAANIGYLQAQSEHVGYSNVKASREASMYDSKVGGAIPWIEKGLNMLGNVFSPIKLK